MAYNKKELVTDADKKPVPQYYNETADAYEVAKGSDGALHMKLTGSYAILKGEAKPAGAQNNTLLEYDTETGETTVYKYISGAWREL
jgi:hypothetical protein